MKAFPSTEPIYGNNVVGVKQSTGMELRDYFASQALAGGLEQGVENDVQTNWWHSPERIAQRAYEIADAMMKAREK